MTSPSTSSTPPPSTINEDTPIVLAVPSIVPGDPNGPSSSWLPPPLPPAARERTEGIPRVPSEGSHVSLGSDGRASTEVPAGLEASHTTSAARPPFVSPPPRLPSGPVSQPEDTPALPRAEDMEEVEVLRPLSMGRVGPIEAFFVQCDAAAAEVESSVDSAGPPRNEAELLLERLAEFTADDSFFSSGSTVMACDPRRLETDPMRFRATRSVHETLALRSWTGGRVAEDQMERDEMKRSSWLYQVHHRALALDHSSFFVFPPRWPPRVVVYNVLHHWLMEVCLFTVILSYAIFEASWARHTDRRGQPTRPLYVLWADVFYLVLYALEWGARLFASGVLLHPRAFFRSPWRWLDTAVLVLTLLACTKASTLWNFTAWRLLRLIKCLTYAPSPVEMKLLAKSLLRSTNGIAQVWILVLYLLLFFALLGQQLFSGTLHARCVGNLSGEVTNQVCRPRATGTHGIYRGYHCAAGYHCVADIAPNPHATSYSFDNVGFALLSAFQIMTFQGWTSLLNETSDAVGLLGVFYYAFVILLCTWIFPALCLGVFLGKIERTHRLFALKQFDLLDSMVHEQRQRLHASVRLRHFVERDKAGRVPYYPLYNYRQPEGNTGEADAADADRPPSPWRHVPKPHWTDEQRIQLQLSLTRQWALADSNGPSSTGGAAKTAAGGAHAGQPSTEKDTVGGAAPAAEEAPATFALSGQVGDLQHHPARCAIGESHATPLHLAARLETEAMQLRFLDPYQVPSTEVRPASSATPSLAESQGRSASPVHTLRGPERNVLATRETAGVVPNWSALGVTGRPGTAGTSGTGSGADPPVSGKADVPMALVVNDPQGGDFRYATTLRQKLAIVQNIVHVVTEGYPRILTQYLWARQRLRHRYGLVPLGYRNKYEEEVLRRLRRRRSLDRDQGATERLPDLDEPLVKGEEEEEEREDLGGASPMEMAQRIRASAPITPFRWIMLCFVLVNTIINATRYSSMSSAWEEGLFVLGVCFSAVFLVELVVRLVALGPMPFLADAITLVETLAVLLSFFQLGYSRSNTIVLFQWVRVFRCIRRVPCRPLREVSQVLRRGAPAIAFALFFFSVYMFMWVLIGMGLFGARIRPEYPLVDSDHPRGSFESFSFAVYAVAQAASVSRDEWLYLSWSGMRARGGYTIMYFIATTIIAVLFRYYFIAVFVWVWQSVESSSEDGSETSRSRWPTHEGGGRLRWFDFTVWRSFKHIHGGFRRRDVAPDEVYHLHDDMRRQLRIAEAKDRFYKETYTNVRLSELHTEDTPGPRGEAGKGADAPTSGPQYIHVNGQLHRRPVADSPAGGPHGDGGGSPRDPMGGSRETPKAQLRFAREGIRVLATTYNPGLGEPDAVVPAETSRGDVETRATPEPSQIWVNPIRANRHSLARSRTDGGSRAGGAEGREVLSAAGGGGAPLPSASVAAQLVQLRHAAGPETPPARGAGGRWEHLLLPGPRLRYQSVVQRGHRVFACCSDCNTHKQMPLPAPPRVEQRGTDALHAEHCHMAAVRSSRQLILRALIGYVRLQKEHEATLSKKVVETVLGQAWGCGMLLFETIDHLAGVDCPVEERGWDPLLEALELQQWLLGLHVGEEQVGRATLAYTLAHQKSEDVYATEQSRSRMERSLFLFAPANPFRQAVTRLVTHLWFERVILLLIFAASICLATYTPGEDNRDFGGSRNGTKYVILHALDDVFTVCFTVEMLLKWVSQGVVLPLGRSYFSSVWNLVDAVIVVVSIVSWAAAGVFLRYLKVIRCIRLVGLLRYARWNPSLAHLSRVLWNGMPTLAVVCLFMLLHYVVWAILLVSMFMNKMSHCQEPSLVDRDACLAAGYAWEAPRRNFQNFPESLLTTWELSSGAEWMDVLYAAVDAWSTTAAPLPNRHPYLGLVLVAYYYLAHGVLFSLFAATVVHLTLRSRFTADGARPVGWTMEHQLWGRMQEWVARRRPRVWLLPMGCTVSRGVHRWLRSPVWEPAMAGLLLANLLTMALARYGMSSSEATALDVLQWIFVGGFTVEVVLRFVAYGPRTFSRPAYLWDLLVTCLSYIQIGLNTTTAHKMPFNVNVLRLLRLGRVLHLVEWIVPFHTHFHLFLEVVKTSVPGLVNVTLLYLLFVYVFAILGLHFLGYIVPYGGYIDDRYNNFSSFPNALIMVFRLSTLENWVAMLRGSMDRGNYCDRGHRCGPTNWAPVYYIPIVLVLFLLIATLYLAVLLDAYLTAIWMRSCGRHMEHLRRFRELWSRRDPNATFVLPTSALPGLLEELRPPLGLRRRSDRVELLRLLQDYGIPDHHGQVHYLEVILPLARRVVAMVLHEDEETLGGDDSIAWGVWESALGGALLPAPSLPESSVTSTAAEYFATTYVQAACRRTQARRVLSMTASAVWRAGRAKCEASDLPYDRYGFGRIALSGPDPGEASRAAGPREEDTPTIERPSSAEKDPAALLPLIYHSAIRADERRFGPNAPGAIRRHERRTDKLRRKQEEEGEGAPGGALEYPMDSAMDSRLERDGEGLSGGGSSFPPSRSASQGVYPVAEGSMPSPSRFRAAPTYSVDPSNPSHQPPLGTNPEVLREQELLRHHSSPQSFHSLAARPRPAEGGEKEMEEPPA